MYFFIRKIFGYDYERHVIVTVLFNMKKDSRMQFSKLYAKFYCERYACIEVEMFRTSKAMPLAPQVNISGNDRSLW